MGLLSRRRRLADEGALNAGTRRIAAVLVDVALPGGVEADALVRLRAPLGMALAAGAFGAVLALLALVDLARLLVGAGAVAAVLGLGLLLLPVAKLVLGVPSGPMGAIVHAAPLLRAIDLGDALGSAWRWAALVSPIGPVVLSGLACAAVLVARGALLPGIVVAAAATVGGVAAWLAVGRSARMLSVGQSRPSATWRAMAQTALLIAVALGAAAAAPLLDADVRATLGPAALPVALAVAVHLAAELLALDARGLLRLARALVGCGRAPWRIVAVVLVGGVGCAALPGAAMALAILALSGEPRLAALAGFGAAGVITSAIGVLLARPAASDVVPRAVLMGAALVPSGLALAAGSWPALAAVLGVALAAVGCATRVRVS